MDPKASCADLASLKYHVTTFFFLDILYVISHICGKATSVAEPATFLATPAPSLPILTAPAI